jgi:hypothetical protein
LGFGFWSFVIVRSCSVWRKKKVDELVVVKLLNRAKTQIDDPVEVNRLLREVAKFFDPLTGQAMLGGAARAELMALLDRGEQAAVLAAIDRYIDNYQKRMEPEKAAEPSAQRASPSCAAS